MKIRTGFVSNSSSSSFCIIGEHIDNESFFKGEVPWEEGMIFIGGYTDDGEVLTQISKPMYDMIVNSVKKPICMNEVNIIKNSTYYDSGSKLLKHKKDSVLYCGTSTQIIIEDSDFEEEYIYGGGMINF